MYLLHYLSLLPMTNTIEMLLVRYPILYVGHSEYLLAEAQGVTGHGHSTLCNRANVVIPRSQSGSVQ